MFHVSLQFRIVAFTKINEPPFGVLIYKKSAFLFISGIAAVFGIMKEKQI